MSVRYKIICVQNNLQRDHVTFVSIKTAIKVLAKILEKNEEEISAHKKYVLKKDDLMCMYEIVHQDVPCETTKKGGK